MVVDSEVGWRFGDFCFRESDRSCRRVGKFDSLKGRSLQMILAN